MKQPERLADNVKDDGFTVTVEFRAGYRFMNGFGANEQKP